jgi:hypothetical protein
MVQQRKTKVNQLTQEKTTHQEDRGATEQVEETETQHKEFPLWPDASTIEFTATQLQQQPDASPSVETVVEVDKNDNAQIAEDDSEPIYKDDPEAGHEGEKGGESDDESVKHIKTEHEGDNRYNEYPILIKPLSLPPLRGEITELCELSDNDSD